MAKRYRDEDQRRKEDGDGSKRRRERSRDGDRSAEKDKRRSEMERESYARVLRPSDEKNMRHRRDSTDRDRGSDADSDVRVKHSSREGDRSVRHRRSTGDGDRDVHKRDRSIERETDGGVQRRFLSRDRDRRRRRERRQARDIDRDSDTDRFQEENRRCQPPKGYRPRERDWNSDVQETRYNERDRKYGERDMREDYDRNRDIEPDGSRHENPRYPPPQRHNVIGINNLEGESSRGLLGPGPSNMSPLPYNYQQSIPYQSGHYPQYPCPQSYASSRQLYPQRHIEQQIITAREPQAGETRPYHIEQSVVAERKTRGGDNKVRQIRDHKPDKCSQEEKNARKLRLENERKRVYLSKLDISTELADPAVYEQCASLLDRSGDNTTSYKESYSDFDKEQTHQLEVDPVAEALIDSHTRPPLFPELKDHDTFQTALSLYQRAKKRFLNFSEDQESMNANNSPKPPRDGINATGFSKSDASH